MHWICQSQYPILTKKWLKGEVLLSKPEGQRRKLGLSDGEAIIHSLRGLYAHSLTMYYTPPPPG